MYKRKLLGVTGHNEIVREADSRGIINIDNNSLKQYKKDRDLKLKLARVIEEHDSFKSELEEIKILLKQILNKK
jgi:hypothetical protein